MGRGGVEPRRLGPQLPRGSQTSPSLPALALSHSHSHSHPHPHSHSRSRSHSRSHSRCLARSHFGLSGNPLADQRNAPTTSHLPPRPPPRSNLISSIAHAALRVNQPPSPNLPHPTPLTLPRRLPLIRPFAPHVVDTNHRRRLSPASSWRPCDHHVARRWVGDRNDSPPIPRSLGPSFPQSPDSRISFCPATTSSPSLLAAFSPHHLTI